MYNTYQGVTINGGRLAFFGGSGPSDYIEVRKAISVERGGQLMSDFELLSIVLMVLAIIIPLLLEVIKTQKK